MSGIILLCVFNISHFSPTVSSAAMAKRAQQGSGEERVTAKSKTCDESYCEDAIGRVVFNFSDPGEEILRKTKILGGLLLQMIGSS